MRLRGCIQALLADVIFHGLSLLGLTHLCMTKDLSVLSNGETAVNLSRFFLFWYRLGQVLARGLRIAICPLLLYISTVGSSFLVKRRKKCWNFVRPKTVLR